MSVPTWATADPLIRYLMAAGLTLEEAFGKAEREAMQADAPDLPVPKAPVVCGDLVSLREACLAWMPGNGPHPVRQYAG